MMTRVCSGARGSAALLAFGLGLGCSNEGQVSSLDVVVEAGCDGESYSACNPFDAGCQERTFSTVRCLRAMPDAVLPEVRLITANEYAAELSRSFAEPDPSAPSAGGFERILALLGLAMTGELSPESFVTLYVETVPGYYSAGEDRITLIERPPGERSDAGQDTLLLAHELSHALQDQDVDLTTLRPEEQTFDEYLAITSVIEGEASMLEAFFSAAMWGLDGDPDFRSHFVSWVERAEEAFGSQSPLTVGPRYFPYSYGARYVYNVYDAGGSAAVRELYRNLPTSVLPMLLSVDGVVQPEPDSLGDLVVPVAPDGYTLGLEETLGPWVLRRFLERSLSASSPAELVSHWRDDRLLVYEAEAGVFTGVWLLRFDDAASAERFSTLFEARPPLSLPAAAFAVRSERDVAIGVMDEPSAATEWQAAVEVAQAGGAASTRLALDVTPTPSRRSSATAKRRLLRALQ